MPVNDPVGTIGSEEKFLLAFRKTRDEIEEKLRGMISDIEKVMMILSLKRGAQGSRGNDELSMINLQSSIKEYSLIAHYSLSLAPWKPRSIVWIIHKPVQISGEGSKKGCAVP